MSNVLSLAPLFRQEQPAHFTSIGGITNAVYAQFTAAHREIYEQLFAIFNYHGLDFYLFAGSMVGFVRNEQMPPWMDDIDLIVFADQIQLFEEKVIPHLRRAGFNNCKPSHYPNGGYHILSLQMGGSRELTIPYSEDIHIPVPWAQIDVFYTEVDSEGLLKNPSAWGLYHQKQIPVDWVKPGRDIHMMGMRIKAFSQYEMDIEKEYGDVARNVIVSTHDKIFLKLENVDYAKVECEFTRIQQNALQLPPSVTPLLVNSYQPVPGLVYETRDGNSFDKMLSIVLNSNAESIRLVHPNHLFWAMDLKRILPRLKIEGVISQLGFASRATHLRKYFDSITGATEEITNGIQKQISELIGLSQ